MTIAKRPMLYVFIPFAAGIAAARYSDLPPCQIFCLSLLLFLASLVFIKKRVASHAALYAAVACFGIFYYQSSALLPADHIKRFVCDAPNKAELIGLIADDPVASVTPYNKLKTSFTLKAESVKESQSWSSARGLVDVAIYGATFKPVYFGQRVRLEGVLSRPSGLKNPGLFDYENYLAIKDIYASFRVKEGAAVEVLADNVCGALKKAAYIIRGRMRSSIDRYFDAPYSGFIKAIMIGDRTDLKYSLNSDFVKTGTVHAIAISGLNVGLIAAMLMSLLSLVRLPKKVNLVIAVSVMVLYTFIAGSSPPIIRAVIIFAVFAAGYLINRESEMLNSLAFTAIAMLLANPKELFDPSFRLSFVSIAGMIIFIPKMNSLLGVNRIKRDSLKNKSARYLMTALAVSISASLATWPIVAAYFNIISPVALLANLVVVPALFLLTAGSFVFLSAGLICAGAAAVTANVISLFCGALFRANHALACMPLAYIRVPAPSSAFMWLYYGSLLLLLAPAEIGTGRMRIRRRSLLAAMLVLCNMLVWREAISMNGDGLKITFMDVGQGDSALLELPGGRNILVDAGPGGDDDSFDAARSVIAPYLWNRNINRLDAAVITHFHEDHLGGAVYLLENFKIDRVVDSGASCNDSEIFDKYLRAVKSRKVHRVCVKAGDRMIFNNGTITVLNPENNTGLSDCNENSIVLKVDYKNFSALFCGDASGSALQRMTEAYGRSIGSDVIKIPHHGGNVGDEKTLINFFDACGAKAAVISVARKNKYRSPSHKTLSIINGCCPEVYQTKDSGAVIVYVNSDGYRIEPYIKNI